jgi:hypothetical protein
LAATTHGNQSPIRRARRTAWPPQHVPARSRASRRALVSETADADGLRRAVGTLDLTALGTGAIIATGIFVIIGEGGRRLGAVDRAVLRVAGVTCLFSALS